MGNQAAGYNATRACCDNRFGRRGACPSVNPYVVVSAGLEPYRSLADIVVHLRLFAHRLSQRPPCGGLGAPTVGGRQEGEGDSLRNRAAYGLTLPWAQPSPARLSRSRCDDRARPLRGCGLNHPADLVVVGSAGGVQYGWVLSPGSSSTNATLCSARVTAT